MSLTLDHAGIAFLMVLVAGFATCVGASAVFCQCCVKLASKRVLAAGLAFSAGIMLYVSFIEIFQKAKGGFEAAGLAEKHAYMASTLCTFLGMLIMRLLIAAARCLDPDHEDFELVMPGCDASQPSATEGTEAPAADIREISKEEKKGQQEKRLLRMGLNTALAITIHNFPEGLAGMVAGLIDPTVGFTLTSAIAIHNIPEGLCIALPIYYSTGSRLRGFLLSAAAGLAEPVGALIAWGIVGASGEDMHGTIYGILFGLVAGIMIMIVALELLPTAHRFDPKDTVVTHALVAGMLVMATSLVLFMV
ncbi:zupT [Symbiodinium natans]|uniref:ZupT protein n=1 Tax=Symbiodinium natans TaxID=878477 RepID=A0A812SWK3_9DINO|nr:zupT [Symbiodinium natans]